MIKAVGERDGRPLLILGLSGESMTRLMADEPILVKLAELDLPDVQVLLIGGRTERHIAEQLAKAGIIPRSVVPPEADG